MLKLQRIIIFLFVTSLLISNLAWAGSGALDNLLDNADHVAMDVDNDVTHHIVDEHHDGHDCHMSAHLVGLNSPVLSLTNTESAQIYPFHNIHFTSYKLPPPNKPPRT